MVEGANDLVAAEFLGFDKLRTVLFGIQEPFPVKEVPVKKVESKAPAKKGGKK